MLISHTNAYLPKKLNSLLALIGNSFVLALLDFPSGTDIATERSLLLVTLFGGIFFGI